MDLHDKLALITGGESGLGRGAARELLKRGARVAILGHTADKVKKAAQELGATPLVGDISLPADLERCLASLDRIDILFANAGINGVWAPLEELTPEEFEKTIRVNLVGTFLTVRAAVPKMGKGGSIIITSSVNGSRMFSNTGATAYACSKAGQVALAKMLALELAPRGIRVNVICPGAIESEIDENTEKKDVEAVKPKAKYPGGTVPLTGGRPGRAEQVGSVVAFLASDLASHVTGTELWIDGGQSLLQG